MEFVCEADIRYITGDCWLKLLGQSQCKLRCELEEDDELHRK